MSIFQEPQIDKLALEKAKMKSQQSLESLLKTQLKDKLSNRRKKKQEKPSQPKEKFESLMKRILDKGATR